MMHIPETGNLFLSAPHPVSTPLIVDPSMAPSSFNCPVPPFALPSPAVSLASGSGDEEPGFPGFRSCDSAVASSTEAAVKAPSFGSTQRPVPVSLPLGASEWNDILSENLSHAGSLSNDSVRTVVEESVKAELSRVTALVVDSLRRAEWWKYKK